MTSSPPLPPCALDLYGEQVFLKPATQYCFAELVEPYQEAVPSVGTPRGFRLGPPEPVNMTSMRRMLVTRYLHQVAEGLKVQHDHRSAACAWSRRVAYDQCGRL